MDAFAKQAAEEEGLTPGGRRFLGAAAAFLILFFVAAGYYTVSNVRQMREDARLRHKARIDPNAVEPGRTAADDALPADAKPREVTVGMYLDGIASLSILDAKWNPVFYIWFKWRGDDINPGETFVIVEGEILSKTLLESKVVDGEHYARYLVKAEVTKFFNGSRFPVDDHLLTISIEDGAMTWQELTYVPDTANSAISSRVKMPGYAAYQSGIVMKPHAYKSNFGDPTLPTGTKRTYAQLIYSVWNIRSGYGPYLKVFIGLYAAILIAMLAFFVKPTDVDPRFGLGVGGFFGAVANALLSASLVPDAGVFTLMDMVNGVGMITIFLTLVQSTISLYLFDIRDNVALSRAFDKLCFVLFTLGSVTIHILLPTSGIVTP